MLDENSESGRKQRRDVWEATKVWVRSHDKDAAGNYVVGDRDEYGIHTTISEQQLEDFEGWTIDVQATDIASNEPPATTTYLGRPMRGQVLAPDDMWNKLGLCPLGRVFSDKNCAIEQLAVCMTHRAHLARPAHYAIEQCTTSENLMQEGGIVDKVFEKLYPGALAKKDPFKPWNCLLYTSPSPRDRG